MLGSNRAELFANAATCVFDLMLHRESIAMESSLPVSIDSPDSRELFLDWLRELLFAFSSREFAVARAELIELGTTRLRARLVGEPYNPSRHGLKVELKTPTYHGYLLEETPAGWRAVVLFDA